VNGRPPGTGRPPAPGRRGGRDRQERFGEQFTYTNDNGNPAIDKRVLKAFRKITGETVVWNRWGSSWRRRTEGDAAGRKQE
jgi:hypothetical protein